MTISDLAISGLNGSVQSLLPPPGPGVEHGLVVAPVRLTPTGIGGFVGLNQEPIGEIIGKRVEARVLVTVRSNNLASVEDSTTSLVTSLLSSNRETLLQSGILRLSLDEIGSAFTIGNEFAREVRFHVLYEFLQRPTVAGDVIRGIWENYSLPDEGFLSATAAGDFLDRFEVVDDPAANRSTPSRWEYNGAEARVEQRSNIWGGSSVLNANKPGTYLVLRTSQFPAVENFNLDVRLSSDDNDGIGLVFRWQDVENFYFFLMDSQRNHRLMGKKVSGTFRFLDTSAVDNGQGYTPGTWYRVRVNALGPELRVYLDGALVLQGQDSSISSPGRVGFMARQNNQAYFYGIELARLGV